jgi:FlaA1/EpsC-like NDP-sugar epimerase
MPRIGGNRLIFVDPVVIALCVALSLLLAAGSDGGATPAAYLAAGVLPIVARPALNVRFGLYRRVWRHASIAEMVQIVIAATAGSLVCIACVLLLLPLTGTADPLALRSYWALEGLLSLAMVGGVRFAIRARAEGTGPSGHSRADGVPTILYGAGAGGVMVVRAARDPRSGIRPVGFLDDDSRLWGRTVAELPVGGDLDRLQDLVQETGAQRLLITINNAPGEAVRRIVREATRIGLEVRMIPRMHDMFDGAFDAYRIRRVRVDDLLRRPAVTDHVEGVRDLIAGRSVMVTGAGGSIGSELARQVFAMRPARLILVDRAEGPLYGIQRELELGLRNEHGAGELSVHIANVVTRSTMERLMRTGQPDIVFHAAAYKHVPMMEEHPSDAVHVNLGGTLSVLDAAEAYNVPHFVFVSTDKAVRPTSVMGATKRVAEALVTDTARRTGNRYVSVRFGNVLGSSWSVVPIFQQQLENREPLTITHPDMTRYFMTIPEAVWLILDAAALGPSGSLLALDMGEPVRIVDLAADLVRLSGLDADSVPINYTGLRPGEKLHEQLFYADEDVKPTANERVMLASKVAELDGIRESVSSLLARADGANEAALRSDLFALTDALEAKAIHRPKVDEESYTRRPTAGTRQRPKATTLTRG